jgi:hypothetical protein
MAVQGTTKQAAYDNAVYLARSLLQQPVSVAGAAGTMGAIYCPTALTVYGVAAWAVVAGTAAGTVTVTNSSTAAGTGGFTAVSIVSGTKAAILNAYRVSGTATTTYANALIIGTANFITTQTTLSGGTLVTTASQSNVAGYAALANGGVNCSAGDQLYVLEGTDATATSIMAWEVGYTAGGNVLS